MLDPVNSRNTFGVIAWVAKGPIMPRKSGTIRRSVALPEPLVKELAEVAPRELRGNLNRLVVVSLQEFVARRKLEAFQEAMARMAADPAIRAECAAIHAEFTAAEADGLPHD
jgi:hypothetical protein